MMSNFIDPQARRVTVPDRDEFGIVIEEGKNIGMPSRNIYCIAVYFESTGEVRYYEKGREVTVS